MTAGEVTSEQAQSRLESLLAVGLRVDAEVIAYGVMIILAVITRFYALETRVMSHDEVSHVYYSWNLYRGLGFQHNPLMHGPVQFHLVALSYFLFGATDATARFPAALSGVIAVALIWVFRRWLGRPGALVAAALMLVSPYMLYYSRYVRNEVFVVVEGLLMAWAVFRYFETRKARWVYLLAASLSLHFGTKETAFIYAAQLLLFLACYFIWEVLKREWERPAHKVAFISGSALAVGGLGLTAVFFFRDLVSATKGLSQGGQASGVPASPVMIMGFVLAVAGAVVLIASLLASFGARLRTEFPSLDLLIISGTLTLPQLSAVSLPAEAMARYGQSADPQALLDPTAVQRLWIALPVIFIIGAAVGLAWDWRRWIVAAGVFAALYVPFYTTLFTHALGLTTGAIGSLAYWLGQQGVERGSQPWYFFVGIQIPIYEFLPVVGALIAALYGARRLIKRSGDPASVSESEEGSLRPFPVLPFIGYWVVTSLFAYSLAGEKMPWLSVHITLPLILLAGWGIGKFLESIDWRAFRLGKAWLVTVILGLTLLSLGSALGYLLGANRPFQGSQLEQLQATSGFLTSLGFGVGSLVALWYVTREWAQINLAKLTGLVGLLALFLLTVRSAFRASYINYDDATEYLVYAHSGPGAKILLEQVEDLSKRTTGGLAIDVAYDNETSYPYMWYLRDYTNVHPFGASPTRDLLNYPIVIVGDPNWGRVEPLLADRYYSFEYIRMWWPMQDYFGLTWKRVFNALGSPEYREALWDIWLNRDYTAYGDLTGTDFSLENWQPSARMRLYVRKDIASLVWNYGALPSTLSPEPVVDPYASRMTQKSADLVVGQLGTTGMTFVRPRGIALAPDGTLFVADTGANRIVHLSESGELLNVWGSPSEGEVSPGPAGTLNEPWDVAVAPDGTVFVADTWNHRIQHFTADGRFLGMFGIFGQAESPDAFWGPRGVAVDRQGRLFVADTGNKRVAIFDAQGNHLGGFGGAGYESGNLDEPVGVAFGADGTVYVADTWNMRIQGFTEVSPGTLESVIEWTIEGWYGQSLDNKPYLATAPNGDVCASDPEGYRILCFTPEGEFVTGWGDFGSSNAQLGLPSGVVFDSMGNLWVTDANNNRIMRFADVLP